MGTFTLALKKVIDLTDGAIGLDEYPIFDEAYRETLNKKIIDHYWNQEIGQETIDMFRHALKRKMNEIMPLYNQFYKSELLAINPLLSFSTESHSTQSGESQADSLSESNATNATESDSRGRVVSSSTPQSMLAADGEYADAAQDTVSGATSSGTGQDVSTVGQTGTQSGESSSTASGFSTSQAGLLLEYRNTFLNIDVQILSELGELFMLVWANGDEYTQGHNYYPFGVFR